MNRRFKSSVMAALAIVSCMNTLPAAANQSVEVGWARKGNPHDFVYGLSFEGQEGLAVGASGLMLSTKDGGANWEKVAAGAPKSALLSVSRTLGKCLASGQEGSILRSDDCKNWETIKPPTTSRLLGIASNAKGDAYTVGEFGTVLRSSDWGKTWVPMRIDWKALLGNDVEPHLYAVHVADDGSVTLVGEFELVIRSVDGGSRWDVLHKGQKSLFGLSFGQNGRVFAVGQEGLILKSEDSGKTWIAVDSRISSILTDVWVSRDGSKVVAVGARAILISRDGGRSFAVDQSPSSTRIIYSSIKAVEVSEKNPVVFVGGTAGSIIRLTF